MSGGLAPQEEEEEKKLKGNKNTNKRPTAKLSLLFQYTGIWKR